MGIIDTVRETVLRHGMIKNGDTVITGLSGGADSVCLLLCLKELSDQMDFALRAVHVNHCMRGDESDRDEAFCAELCGRLDIPVEVHRVDVYAFVEKTGKSPEEAARELRYSAFEKAAQGRENIKIATAHNKGDNTETVIFNISRGTGSKGICGIPYVRQLADVQVIRPLLGVSREEIEAFLEQRQQCFVTDSTNLTEDYTRNKIRARIIPVLKEINPSVHTAVERLSDSAYEDESFFDEYISRIPDKSISQCHGAVRKRYIRKILSENHIECSYERIIALDGMLTGGKDTRCCLSGDVFAVFRKGIMTIEKISQPDDIRFEKIIDFASDRVIDTGLFDKRVIISGAYDDIFNKNGIINKKLTKNVLNYAKIQGDAVLRNKRDGDKIMFSGRDFSTKLKKLYNEMKLSADERACALVIEDEAGIIWSEYGGVCERVSVKQDDTISDVYEVKVDMLNSIGYAEKEIYGYEGIKKILISEEEIQNAVKRLGDDISEEYAGKPLLIISILKGAFMFHADLIRAVKIPCEIGFMAAQSYGSGTVSSGDVQITLDLKQDISQYNVIIAEDIVDTGNTLSKIYNILKARNPVSLKVYTLLDKPERRVNNFKADKALFTIPDLFVVGYGLDYDEKFRNLPFIAEAEL